MPTVITAWIRHGHYVQPEGVPSAHLPHPLTDRGREQARKCAEALLQVCESRRWVLHPTIDTSRMLRAWETGSILATELSGAAGTTEFTVEEFESLAERCVGAAANLTLEEIAAVVEKDPRFEPLPDRWKYQSDFALPFQNAESMLDAGHRVATHIEGRASDLAESIQVDTLKLVIGHGGAFRHAAVHLGLLDLADVPGLSMWHCSPVYMGLSDGRWSHVAGEWKVRDEIANPD